MAATIKEVAKMAGCSITTVSRAFNNSSAVNPETLKKIENAAAYFEYTPNTIAQAMVKQRNHNIAFVVDEKHFPVHMNPFYAAIAESVRDNAVKKGYNVYVVSSKSFSGDASDLIKSKKVDGVIIAGKCHEVLLERLYLQNAPIVLVNSVSEKYDLIAITADDYKGTVLAVEHLIKNGHTKIALLAGNIYSYISGIRQQAFIDTMKKHNLGVASEYIQNSEADIPSSIENATKLLKLKNPPTAFFCMNDVVGVGTIKAAIRMGLRVPEDVAVIGFDNSSICNIIEPELTSINIDTQKMGELSVKALDKIITGAKVENKRICLETKLIKRQST